MKQSILLILAGVGFGHLAKTGYNYFNQPPSAYETEMSIKMLPSHDYDHLRPCDKKALNQILTKI